MNFTAQQLRQQLKDGVKPVNDSSNDLNSLLETALKSVMKGTDVLETKSFAVLPGTHGMWRGPLNEVAFGVLLDTNVFQKYKASLESMSGAHGSFFGCIDSSPQNKALAPENFYIV